MDRVIKFRFFYGIDGEAETYFSREFTFGEIESGFHMEEIANSSLLNKYSILGKAQFTGLHDRNGVEVYEGDFMLIKEAEERGDGAYDDVLALVSWSAPDGAYFTTGDDWYNFLAVIDDYDTEVIGNRFEHPELLEQEG